MAAIFSYIFFVASHTGATEREIIMKRMSKSSSAGVRKLTVLALLTAIVVVLQLLGGFIKLGTFSISLVLVPIVIGAALSGAVAGAWLGFVFGCTVLLTGDAAVFLAVNPIGTVVTVLLKGIMAGFFAGLFYHTIPWKHQNLAVLSAAMICPIVNTGVFLLGCLVFFMPTMVQWAQGMGFGDAVGTYMIVGLVGVNFLIEFLINVLLCSTMIRILHTRTE